MVEPKEHPVEAHTVYPLHVTVAGLRKQGHKSSPPRPGQLHVN